MVLQLIPIKTMGDVRFVSYIVLNNRINTQQTHCHFYRLQQFFFLLLILQTEKKKLSHMQDVECCNKIKLSFLEMSWMLLWTSIQNEQL